MTTERDLGPQLSARLTYLLKRALIDLENLHAEYLAPVGVSGRELAVLLLLDSHSPESQQQVAGRLGVDRTTMVALLDGLEAKGLVARHADAGDRRRNVVELTGSGHTTLGQAVRASDEAERQLLADLNDAESAQLRTLLTRLARTVRSPRTDSGRHS
ncbi:MarR family transcriptional regulator [Dactylosporangium vinaceum]|uniref:MarR family winged helix-turn-helix transcriptional regulator n=1 Tax=Dactylosporangium vinaceum TaxID=53362 RepID=A0ABV5MK76_9ACTN|nr:MarR family transcriptional regulator [Dactylosporangium vinaceum]UAB99648.1 MarR family transcriptional regulator [Dactylosporangium vinaceum]